MTKHRAKTEGRRRRSSTIATYCRLIRTFARPYWLRLLVGILSGFVIGGAMATSLRVMDVSFNVFETGVMMKKTQEEQPAPRPARPNPHRHADGPPGEIRPPRVPAPAPGRRTTGSARELQKRDELFQRLNRMFDSLGIDIVMEPHESLTLPVVAVLLALLFGFFLLQSGGEVVNKYCLRWVGSRVVVDIRTALFSRLQGQSLAFFTRNSVGALISRCTNDTQAIEYAISTSLCELFTAPIFILVSLQFIIQKTRESNLESEGLLVLLALPFCILPFYLLSRLLKRYQKRVLERISLVISCMQEAFSGIQVIKAFHREAHESRRFAAVNDRLFRSLRKAILADICVQPMMQLSAIGLAAVFVLICYQYEISFGTLAIIGFASHQAYRPLKELAKINASLQRSAAAAERIFEILDTDTALPERPDPVPLDGFRREIRFERLSFAYAPGEAPVLQDIDLAIPRGSLIALVGQTGSGKSTLAHLLARFYDPTSGRITIDGHDLRDLRIDDLRRMIGIVSQDTFLFNDTIAENIRYGKLDATDEEVRQAAEQASAAEFIARIPGQYGHVVGERGVLLSGGQKQRLAIARAILKNPPILILDEATSALDTVTEQLVQQAINNVMQDRTVLAIAHRLSTIQKADLILVMDQGRIVERGTHQSLYAQNGPYRTLCDMQFHDGR